MLDLCWNHSEVSAILNNHNLEEDHGEKCLQQRLAQKLKSPRKFFLRNFFLTFFFENFFSLFSSKIFSHFFLPKFFSHFFIPKFFLTFFFEKKYFYFTFFCAIFFLIFSTQFFSFFLGNCCLRKIEILVKIQIKNPKCGHNVFRSDSCRAFLQR